MPERTLDRRLAALNPAVATIRSAWEDIVANTKRSVECGLKIGRILVEAKQTLRYGEFIAWVEHNFRDQFSIRHARRMMGTYRAFRVSVEPENDSCLTNSIDAMMHNYKPPQPPKKRLVVIDNDDGFNAEPEESQAVADAQSGRPVLLDKNSRPVPVHIQEEWKAETGFGNAWIKELKGILWSIESAIANGQAGKFLSLASCRSSLQQAIETIKEALPAYICFSCGGVQRQTDCTVCEGAGWVNRRTFELRAERAVRKQVGGLEFC